MGDVIEEIQAQIGGAWILDRTENFEEALEEMGRTDLQFI